MWTPLKPTCTCSVHSNSVFVVVALFSHCKHVRVESSTGYARPHKKLFSVTTLPDITKHNWLGHIISTALNNNLQHTVLHNIHWFFYYFIQQGGLVMLCFMEHNLLVVLCYSLFLLRTVYIIYNKSERERVVIQLAGLSETGDREFGQRDRHTQWQTERHSVRN